MIKPVPELSIFFPFWNEEENIQQVVAAAIPIAKKIAKKWEIIMVDDGSSDKTYEIAQTLAKKDPEHLRTIHHVPNRGYGSALREGLINAKYELITFTDGDGQFDFSEVTKFLDLIGPVDMVIGKRKKRIDHPFRHVLMTLLKIWDFIFFGFYFQDIDCGFKMFKKEAITRILPLTSEGAIITTEILAKAKKQGLRILQVSVNHYPRQYGNQSGGNPRVIFRAIHESFLLWKELR